MTRIKKWLSVLCFISIVGLAVPATASEEETGMSFTYTNKLPDNQLTAGNYFDLLMAPGQEQVLETELLNLTDEDVLINVSVSNATTTESGVIDYGPRQGGQTSNVTYGLVDLVTAPRQVAVPKNGTATLALTVKMPVAAFPGVVLGGIQLQQEEVQEQSEKVLSVNNQYAYVYSLSLRSDKTEPDFDFQSQDTTVETRGDQSVVTVSLDNLAPRIIKELNVEMVVTAKASERIVGKLSRTGLKMAPNSQMRLPIEVAGLEHGQYQTTTVLSIGDETWQWVEEFTVQHETSKAILETPEIHQAGLNWWTLTVIPAVLIMGTGVLYIVIRKY